MLVTTSGLISSLKIETQTLCDRNRGSHEIDYWKIRTSAHISTFNFLSEASMWPNQTQEMLDLD
jgi:hypothetical protein